MQEGPEKDGTGADALRFVRQRALPMAHGDCYSDWMGSPDTVSSL
jgi:hypothetical protein